LFSPLLDALLRRAVAYGNDYPADGPEVRLARVMLDELAALEVAPLLLPVSTEPRLARLMARLVADPGSALGLKELARETGASERTLARLFARETGMSFIQWKMRLRLIASIERLARGATVTDVAANLGYATTSSFIYMFRKQLGVSPGRYQHPGAEDEPLARANPTAMPSASATTASGSPPTPCAS
jgi:AraC-like DNA-binding protein